MKLVDLIPSTQCTLVTSIITSKIKKGKAGKNERNRDNYNGTKSLVFCRDLFDSTIHGMPSAVLEKHREERRQIAKQQDVHYLLTNAITICTFMSSKARHIQFLIVLL